MMTQTTRRVHGLFQFLLQGTGIRKGNIVAVGFGSVACNVVLYQVQKDGSLSGVWGLYSGNQAGTEEAVR